MSINVRATSSGKYSGDYCKIGKNLHDMLAGGQATHIAVLVSLGLHVMLLFMCYSIGHVSLVHTNSHTDRILNSKEHFEIVKQILKVLWRLQVGAILLLVPSQLTIELLISLMEYLSTDLLLGSLEIAGLPVHDLPQSVDTDGEN